MVREIVSNIGCKRFEYRGTLAHAVQINNVFDLLCTRLPYPCRQRIFIASDTSWKTSWELKKRKLTV